MPSPVIAASSGGSSFFLIVIIAFVVLYLLVVRPQRRRQSQQQRMLGEMRVGDEVLTAGGIYGTVTRLDDERVTVEIAPNLEVQVSRRAIAGVTREPETGEEAESGEHGEQDGERWRSAFDEDAGSGAETSNEENRG